MPNAHLAIDLGASSGRAILGVLDGDPRALVITELHRFEHRPCPTPAGPVWDLTGIWQHILQGLRAAQAWCQEHGETLVSVGVDSWGVDWALVGASGELLGHSHCYRDPQNVAAADRLLKQLGGKQRLYERTGIQHMPINTIFQLAARLEHEPALLEAADRFLMIPDLFHFWLSGTCSNELTIASTSGLLALETRDWDRSLLAEIGLPDGLFRELCEPGTVLGSVREEVAEATGVSTSVLVIAPGAHDTASAVAAVPFDLPESAAHPPAAAEGNDEPMAAYLSSGTWSLLGAELDQPFVSEASCEAPFTNELGMNGTVRFLKNIAGLWLIQELRREYVEHGNEISFEELAEQARLADPFRTLIDPNAPQFAVPGEMASKIREFALHTDQPEPETIGDLARCCLDSLALCYSDTIESLEQILGRQVRELHIVGGGCQNSLLNEISCGLLQRPVYCGPVEATAIGNLLTQAMGAGDLSGLGEIRQVVRASFDIESVVPDTSGQEFERTHELMQRYRSLLSQ